MLDILTSSFGDVFNSIIRLNNQYHTYNNSRTSYEKLAFLIKNVQSRWFQPKIFFRLIPWYTLTWLFKFSSENYFLDLKVNFEEIFSNHLEISNKHHPLFLFVNINILENLDTVKKILSIISIVELSPVSESTLTHRQTKK